MKKGYLLLIVLLTTSYISLAETETINPPIGKFSRDGRFIAYVNGIVWDKTTGLEWIAGPDRATNWHEAKNWIESLSVAGGRWQMPTMKELKTLYLEGAGERNMTSLLKTTGWYVWSGETKGSSCAWTFGFILGSEFWSGRDSSYHMSRGFAVRSRK